MAQKDAKRRLTAILSADVMGYSRLMGRDEIGTIETLMSHQKIIADLVTALQGRVVDSPGDNILAAFGSVTDAVNCAIEIQQQLAEQNAELQPDRAMTWRIGIELSDVVEENDQIYGNGVNKAARVEALADPGGICITGSVFDQVKRRHNLRFDYLGRKKVKNIEDPIRVYRISPPADRHTHGWFSLENVKAAKVWRATLYAVILLFLCFLSAVTWWERSKPGDNAKTPSSGNRATRQDPLSQKPLEKPTVAVLPFVNLSGDPDQDYFSDGMTDDIITCLSKNSQLHVIARTSVFTYKERQADIQQISRELGAGYLVEGSIYRQESTIKVNVTLIDAQTEGSIWAEAFESEIENTFDVFHEISRQIAAALIVGYKDAEMTRSRHLHAGNMTAYDLYWRALACSDRTKEGNAERRKFLNQAIRQDPGFAAAYAHLGITHIQDFDSGWNKDPEAVEEAMRLAKKAIASDRSLSDAHRLLAYIYLIRGQNTQAVTEAQWTATLEPNDPEAHRLIGMVLINTGDPRQGIDRIETAMSLDPRNPVRDLYQLGRAYLSMGHYKRAAVFHNRLLTHDPNYVYAYIELSSNYLLQWITLQHAGPQVLDDAMEMARRASSLDSSSSTAYSVLCGIHLWKKEHDTAISYANRLIDLSPRSPDSYIKLANVLNCAGRLKDSLDALERAKRFSPPGSEPYLFELARTYRLLGRYDEALSLQKRYLDENPGSSDSHYEMTVIYVALGEMESARKEALNLMAVFPQFTTTLWSQRVPYSNPIQTQRDVAALRKAGVD